MNSNASTPRSLSPAPEGKRSSQSNNMSTESQRAMSRQVSPNHSRNVSTVSIDTTYEESSQFSSESSDEDNDKHKSLSFFKKQKKEKKSSSKSLSPITEMGSIPPSRNNARNTSAANSNTPTLVFNKTPAKKSFFSNLFNRNKNKEELVLPVTTMTKEDKEKKKKRRNCCLIIFLIIIILSLLGNLLALDVVYLRSPVLQSQNITTLLNDTKTTKDQNIKATSCMILFSSLEPKQFKCGFCLDEQSFYNVTTFCALKSIWANSFNQTSIEKNLSWMEDNNFCDWGGIKCDESKNIISLELNMPNTPRTINSELGNLKTLQRLVLNGNGQIPVSELPSSIFQLENLQELILISTALTGSIPNTFDKMTSLKTLQFITNSLLNSTIPETISQTSLVTLTYNSQNLNGVIPDFIGNSKSLQLSLVNLDLTANRLTGNLPDSLKNLTKLRSLKLSGNLLSGEFPPSLTSPRFAKSLITLDLNTNGFSGTIPASINQFVNLVDLNLQRNSFTGTIPSELSSLGNLANLLLNNNKLSGNLPDFIGKMKLRRLILNGNAFTGALPNNICKTDYQFCDLSKNQLTLPTPASCGVCVV